MVSTLRNVLVVEDDPLVRRAVGRVVRTAGFSAFEADGGQAALAHPELLAGHVDVVLTDIDMPGMDGFALAAELRRMTSPPRILLMTGRTDHSAGRARMEGLALLEKPFGPAELRRILGVPAEPA
jgi:DNA-binding response OmpR family regulator